MCLEGSCRVNALEGIFELKSLRVKLVVRTQKRFGSTEAEYSSCIILIFIFSQNLCLSADIWPWRWHFVAKENEQKARDLGSTGAVGSS